MWGCEAHLDTFEPSAGEANFETIVFIGNSLTAGYRDGTLYRSAQYESFPAIIHKQLYNSGLNKKPFKIPLMADEAGLGGRRILGQVTGCDGNTSLAPDAYQATLNLAANMANIYAQQGPFNNMGVPGVRLPHIFAAGYGNSALGQGRFNPYFSRMASNPMAKILDDALAQQPTFVVTWIGNNDVLGYALAGGYGDTITSIAYFNQLLSYYVNQVYTGNTKGAICNIPPITAAPFFTTIKPNNLVLNASQAAVLNQAYAAYNQEATQLGKDSIKFKEGANFFIIQDTTLSMLGGIRQIKANELLLLTLPQDSLKCGGWGTQKPIPHYYVLDASELANINAATTAYNNQIASLAQQKNLALVDIHTLLSDISLNGTRIEGQTFSTTFVTGQIFSLDGIHLTGKGNAIVANYIIDAINQKYNAKIPKAMVQEYSGNIFP